MEVVLKIKERYPHVDKIRPFGQMIRWAMVNETAMVIKSIGLLIKYVYGIVLSSDKRFKWTIKNLFKIFLESAIFPDLSVAAKKILIDDRVHSVVFGHTHVYEYRKWGPRKEYFNTGTWTELTSLDVVSLGRITKLTYVMFEYSENDSKPNGRLKEWKGFHRIEEDVAVS